jgi:hypothetical protein
VLPRGEAAHAVHSAHAAAGGEADHQHEPQMPDKPHARVGAEAVEQVCVTPFPVL